MTTSTGSAGAQHGLSGDLITPDHLLVWDHGDPRLDPRHRIVDDELGPGFALSSFVHRTWQERPAAVVAATFAGRQPSTTSPSWIELCEVAAGVDHESDHRAFIGDTTPTSLRSLRVWATRQLDGLRYPADDVTLVTSELATNVERHAGGWVTVDMVDLGEALVVAVTDPEFDRLPAPRRVGPDEVSGRGLLVVAAVSAHWGVVVRPASKTVWSVLAA